MIRSAQKMMLMTMASAITLTTMVTAKNLPELVVTQTRKMLNFGSTFGSATAALPYDRIAGHPVFSVTTSYGSPYMTMEKKAQLDEVVQEKKGSAKKLPSKAIMDDQAAKYRTVCLYFMDPDDALSLHGEMKQMDQMKKSDVRLTSFSLSKALRQAANLGSGLCTGQPVDANSGNLPVEEGGALRYKIVPAKRQLYYAARCHGKERVGLFGDTPSIDAATVLAGNSAIQAANLRRRSKKRDGSRLSGPPLSPMQQQNAHMDGYTGIPVFYSPHVRKRLPFIKRMLSGNRFETPLFFNYEDLERTWNEKVQGKDPDAQLNPEVFNMWDVLTSMDRRGVGKPASASQRQQFLDKANPLKALQRRLAREQTPGFEHITFVPSSRAVDYKDSISVRGNSKARLPRQRQWMQHSPS